VHAAVEPHLVHRFGRCARAQDAKSDHGVAAVHGDGPAGVVGLRIIELLSQVFLPEMLILVIDGLHRGHQVRPCANLAPVERPPVEFRM
jgi:hypothetical protein